MSAQNQTNVDQLIKEEIDRLAKEKADDPSAKLTATEPSPLKVTLGGQERTFANPEELSKFVQAQIDAANQAAQQQVVAASSVAQAATANRVTAADLEKPPQPDLKEFANLLEKNPADAFNYIDSFRFGGANPIALMKQMYETQQAQSAVISVMQFREAHPEYERTNENAQALNQVMQAYKLPVTFDGLEMAYALAQQRGLIETKTADEKAVDTSAAVNDTSTVSVGPPRVARTVTNTSPDIVELAEDMDPDDILKVINRLEHRVG